MMMMMMMIMMMMIKEGEGFDYVRQNFPRTSESKIKEGIFVGTQVK